MGVVIPPNGRVTLARLVARAVRQRRPPAPVVVAVHGPVALLAQIALAGLSGGTPLTCWIGDGRVGGWSSLAQRPRQPLGLHPDQTDTDAADHCSPSAAIGATCRNLARPGAPSRLPPTLFLLNPVEYYGTLMPSWRQSAIGARALDSAACGEGGVNK